MITVRFIKTRETDKLILRKLKGGDVMKSLSIHLTDQCNNSCKFCVVDSHQGKPERVARNIIFKFLESNAGKGYESVNIHGGESTIVPEFFEILDKIKELGYPTVSLQTNARKLSDMDFAKEVASRNVDLFIVSVHGKDAEMHDYCTSIQGSFDEAIQGIKNVKSLGKKVRTNTVVCKQNYNYLVDIIDLVMDLGVDHVNISAIHPAGKAFKNFHEVTPRLTEIVPAVKNAVDRVVSRGVVVTLEGFPACVLRDYAKYMINWDEIHFKLLFHKIILKDYNEYMENETRKQGAPCQECVRKNKCGGVYKEYLHYYGWSEFSPLTEAELIGNK